MKRLLLLLLLFMNSVLNAQDSEHPVSQSFRPMIGCSLPELLHIGARYQLDDMQFGVKVGSIPAENESIITYSADMIWHLFGERNALQDKPWYGNVGFTYMREETEFEINGWSYVTVRFGHEFALSNSIALHIDAGMMVQIQHEEIEKKPRNTWFDFDFEFPVLPSIGITTAYTF